MDSLLAATLVRLHRRAQDCLVQVAETVDPECSRLWHKLALDCLRFAAAVRKSEEEGVPISWSFSGVADCS